MTHAALTLASNATDLPEYPISADVRLDSHWFIPWERRRWLNSEMRLKGRKECRALYFDLIQIAFDQSPIGTLPNDMEQLAKLTLEPESEFKALCAMPFGPLHRWEPCLCDGTVRLMHRQVTHTVIEALARKEDNRAMNEAANAKKRRQRLRASVGAYHADLAKNDSAIIWMDDWLQQAGCGYRSSDWIQRGIAAWSNHQFDMHRKSP